jgi:hypothetical protein
MFPFDWYLRGTVEELGVFWVEEETLAERRLASALARRAGAGFGRRVFLGAGAPCAFLAECVVRVMQ